MYSVHVALGFADLSSPRETPQLCPNTTRLKSIGLPVCWSVIRRRIFISIYINIYFSNGKPVSISLLSFGYHLNHFCAWLCCGKVHTNNGEISKSNANEAVRKSCLINDSEKYSKLSGYKLQIPFTFFSILEYLALASSKSY